MESGQNFLTTKQLLTFFSWLFLVSSTSLNCVGNLTGDPTHTFGRNVTLFSPEFTRVSITHSAPWCSVLSSRFSFVVAVVVIVVVVVVVQWRSKPLVCAEEMLEKRLDRAGSKSGTMYWFILRKKNLNVPSDSECNDNRAWSRQRRRRREASVPKWIKLILKNLKYSWLYFFVLFVLKGCNFKASAPCERLPADLGVKTRNMSRASRSGAAGSTAAVLLRFIRPIRRLCDPARRRDVPTLPCHSVWFVFSFS